MTFDDFWKQEVRITPVTTEKLRHLARDAYDAGQQASRAEVAAALDALEIDLNTRAWATVADGKFSKIGHGINVARVELKLAITKLGLASTKENT